jgi:hypothetical protein
MDERDKDQSSMNRNTSQYMTLSLSCTWVYCGVVELGGNQAAMMGKPFITTMITAAIMLMTWFDEDLSLQRPPGEVRVNKDVICEGNRVSSRSSKLNVMPNR